MLAYLFAATIAARQRHEAMPAAAAIRYLWR